MDIATIHTIHVEWTRAFRLIRSIHPPIDLFEDLADPRDWEALASIESKTNPRIAESIGRLDLVPLARRVSGPGATMVMAPFVHASPDRPGRFTTGHYGVYSAGDSEEVAILEVAYHQKRLMRATDEPPGWHSQFRMMIGAIDHVFADLRGFPLLHDPESWGASQIAARQLREAGHDGVHYRSVRCEDGLCVGAFWPDVIGIPKQADHYEMHWDGNKIDRIYNRRTDQEFALS
ncbi:RES domain-containing protein [Altererythrobacter indicus]|uniref:RES domain-containing protein n=1 Tax=Altericroceibacterium indicum TaxID=374177 RepID=A0A845A9L5_9SPHN|nr:RES domain-containing protein [Altericroceibacterium indicum]